MQGFEPWTNGLKVRCSTRLSYIPSQAGYILHLFFVERFPLFVVRANIHNNKLRFVLIRIGIHFVANMIQETIVGNKRNIAYHASTEHFIQPICTHSASVKWAGIAT